MFILSVVEGLGMTVKIYKTEFLKLALMGPRRNDGNLEVFRNSLKTKLAYQRASWAYLCSKRLPIGEFVYLYIRRNIKAPTAPTPQALALHRKSPLVPPH
jgi:hypothetical protein